MAKNAIYQRLIHSGRWLRLRRDILSRHPVCQRCEEEGRLTPACEVHHIVPAETAMTEGEMKALMFDLHNLRALCHDCHVKTHTEMGRSGREATKKRNEEQVRTVVRKFFEDEGGGDFLSGEGSL